MDTKRGYYSVIQYCPDRSRLEAVNVGVLLFCPQLGFIEARTAKSNRRIIRLFGRESFERDRVNAAKEAIETRVRVEREHLLSVDDLRRFIDTRANDLLLTDPRPMRVVDPEADLCSLFEELVGGLARRPKREPKIAALDTALRRPSLQGRIQFNQQVTIPVVGRTLRVPYTYRNGRLHLIKPERFSSDENQATNTAMRLAIEGDLLFHNAENGIARKLIVVTAFEQPDAAARLCDRVIRVLEQYSVRPIREEQIDDFAKEVEREASRG